MCSGHHSDLPEWRAGSTHAWDKTHDEKRAQGWSAFVLDYNGNGKRDAYTEPNDPADPAKDKRLNVQFYGDSPTNDGSVWGSVQGMPGALVRFVPGAHPPETALSEYYEVPWNNPNAQVQGFAPRGMDIDSRNVVWTVLSSGHLASFDRSKCKGPLNGPIAATGQHCPEGWTLHTLPGPNYKGAVENGSADSAYYDIVDRFDKQAGSIPDAAGPSREVVNAATSNAQFPTPTEGLWGWELGSHSGDPPLFGRSSAPMEI